MELINTILTALSDCVTAEEGVLVDFVGDELMAMWGAPADQPDHAERACRAALAMVRKLPDLNRQFQGIVAEPIDVGVGVNSGSARVGNVGSHTKFKYGPVGSVVNMASRVQGITKFYKTRVIVTDSTRQLIGPPLRTRRLGRVRAFNIPDPVDLHELSAEPTEAWSNLAVKYEDALAAYVRQDFALAAGILGALLSSEVHRNDGPCLFLMHKVADYLIEKPDPTKFDGVLNMAK